MASRALLITGATGKQGGSVVNALLKADAPFEIIALTRNVQSASAKRLLNKSPKIKLVSGDFNTIDDVFHRAKQVASAPIWGVFGVQAVSKNEEIEGKTLIDAALRNGVQHFVYTSADRGANSDTDSTYVPHFITKYNIEQHLIAKAKAKAKGSNMTWTILRPVAFFDNLTPGFFGKVFTSTFAWRLGKQQKLQFIGTSDIGFFASQSFLHADSEEFKNKSIPLAGDELTFEQMKEIFEKTTGQPIPSTYTFIAVMLNWMSRELGYMFTWFRDVGFGVDITKTRKINPEMKDFKTWLKTESAWKS